MHDIAKPRRLAMLVAAVAIAFAASACGGDEGTPKADAGNKAADAPTPPPGDGLPGCGPVMDAVISLGMKTGDAEEKNTVAAYKKAVNSELPGLKKLSGQYKQLSTQINKLTGQLEKVAGASSPKAAKAGLADAQKTKEQIARDCGSAS